MILTLKKLTLPELSQVLPGRNNEMRVTDKHFVTGVPIKPPFESHLAEACFGMGCFWGVERRFWQQKGVVSTAVGYNAGITPNPTYDEVCSGLTAHNEVVRVIYDPSIVSYAQLLQIFWTSHNPTQGMSQGNDVGTQYRSGIYTFNEAQFEAAVASQLHYQAQLDLAGYKKITTEIKPIDVFYYAEDYHQQYLAKDPLGYCGLRGLGVEY